jgi:hypothetical protein
MTEPEPGCETEDPIKLRSAAVAALQSAARQKDPNEFDRLTHHAPGLIGRARALQHGKRCTVSGAEEMPASRNKGEIAGKEKYHMPHELMAKCISTLWRLCPWRTR